MLKLQSLRCAQERYHVIYCHFSSFFIITTIITFLHNVISESYKKEAKMVCFGWDQRDCFLVNVSVETTALGLLLQNQAAELCMYYIRKDNRTNNALLKWYPKWYLDIAEHGVTVLPKDLLQNMSERERVSVARGLRSFVSFFFLISCLTLTKFFTYLSS